MRTVVVTVDGDEVVPTVTAEPPFEPMTEWEGEPLDRVALHGIERRGEVELQLVRIAAGGRFAMHASPKLAFCHVVHGAGRLGLPEGRSLAYRGPETFVFHPGSLHDWHDITEDTLMAVAIMPDDT